jgi:Tfp pilus assembly protein PilF
MIKDTRYEMSGWVKRYSLELGAKQAIEDRDPQHAEEVLKKLLKEEPDNEEARALMGKLRSPSGSSF